jgi:mannose-6-phosphate isomerase-like protein (cupin superfamily)
MTMRTRYADIPVYRTKDGSQIRELMHPDHHANRAQSLAEAIVSPGQETLLHKHLRTEELYHITAGRGLMTLGDERFEVGVGDTVLIAPGTEHCIRNTGDAPLYILCSCSPAYSHEDTVLLTGDDGVAVG